MTPGTQVILRPVPEHERDNAWLDRLERFRAVLDRRRRAAKWNMPRRITLLDRVQMLCAGGVHKISPAERGRVLFLGAGQELSEPADPLAELGLDERAGVLAYLRGWYGSPSMDPEHAAEFDEALRSAVANVRAIEKLMGKRPCSCALCEKERGAA